MSNSNFKSKEDKGTRDKDKGKANTIIKTNKEKVT